MDASTWTERINRLEKEWSQTAKENVQIEYIKGTYYAFGSELACLRLMRAYRFNSKANVDYSQNLKSWFFRLETNEGAGVPK